MDKRLTWLCVATGIALLAATGLLAVENRFYCFGLSLLGWTLIVAGLRQAKLGQPTTALALVITSNLAFWGAVLLWRLRPRLINIPITEGIDPFALALGLWFLFFMGASVYELVIFCMNLKNSMRLSIIGIVGVLLQTVTALKYVYELIQGV